MSYLPTPLITVLFTAGLIAIGAMGARAQSSPDPAQMAEGAQVFGDNCMRCHNARSPAERSDQGWATILAHMRARANLTRTEAEAVLVYLKASNPPEHPETGRSSRAVPSEEGTEPETTRALDPSSLGALSSFGAPGAPNVLSRTDWTELTQYLSTLE